jgi:hypothetical protein
VTIIDPAELGALDPARFAALVKRASKRELAEVMAGPDRAAILTEIFRRFPEQFRPARAGSTAAVIHWHVGGRPDGGCDSYEVVIADGTCTVSPAPAPQSAEGPAPQASDGPAPQASPDLSVTLGGVELLLLLSGTAKPMTMFLTGKIKAKGDLGLAANLAHLFELPKA